MSCDFNRANRGRDECGLADGKTEAVSWQNSEPEKSEFICSQNTNSSRKRGKEGIRTIQHFAPFTSPVNRES